MGSDISISMKTAAIVLALALGVSCDTLGGHSHGHGHGLRQGRQEEPLGGYGQPSYGDLDTAASDAADPLAMLQTSVPGIPGEDYPIYAETPETAFSCDGQVDGGYYDEEAQCQVFHICTADGAGGLAKYSFLCPNGTIFNQEYFICDWWFNVDCAESAAIAEAKNSELASTREAASAAAAEAAASDVVDAYAAPEGGYLAPDSGSGLAGYQAEYSRDRSLSGRKAGGILVLPVTYHHLWHYLIKLTAPYM